MEGIGKVRSIPNRQSFRHPRRCSGLDKVLLKQSGKQLCIFHRNQIILLCFLDTILRGELLRSLLSRLLLILLLILLKLGLITQILNGIGSGHNSGDMLIYWIPFLRPTFHHTHFMLFLLGTVNGNTFFDQTSFSDPFFQTHTHVHHLCEVTG
jgi:hypothetical protein